jgi:hypothetical protein
MTTTGPPNFGGDDACETCKQRSKRRWTEKARRWLPTIVALAAHLVELLRETLGS